MLLLEITWPDGGCLRIQQCRRGGDFDSLGDRTQTELEVEAHRLIDVQLQFGARLRGEPIPDRVHAIPAYRQKGKRVGAGIVGQHIPAQSSLEIDHGNTGARDESLARIRDHACERCGLRVADGNRSEKDGET